MDLVSWDLFFKVLLWFVYNVKFYWYGYLFCDIGKYVIINIIVKWNMICVRGSMLKIIVLICMRSVIFIVYKMFFMKSWFRIICNGIFLNLEKWFDDLI